MRDLRRAAQAEMQRAREVVKKEIINQRVSSKLNPKAVENQIKTIFQSDLLSPKILEKNMSRSASQPALTSSRSH